MHNFTADSSLRARKTNWYILLEFSLTCAGEQASRTRSLACLCLCDEIGLLHPSELGQKTALLDILSSFQEVLPDCQSLIKTCLLTIVFWPWLWWITSFALMCLTPFCLKWWTLPALQLSIEFLWHLLIDLIAFHIVYNHIPVTQDLILWYKQFSVSFISFYFISVLFNLLIPAILVEWNINMHIGITCDKMF